MSVQSEQVCQDQFSTDLSLGVQESGYSLTLRPECCIARIMLPEGWEGQLSAWAWDRGVRSETGTSYERTKARVRQRGDG